MSTQEILDFFKDLSFDSEAHKYYVNDVPIRRSVSQIIKDFVKPFDREGIANRVAMSKGVTVESILEDWDRKRDFSIDRGNRVHDFGERYMIDRTLKPSDGFEEAVVKFWNDLPDFVVPILPELQMYHKQFMFAGTADIILYNTATKQYIIADYKTNEDLFKNYKNQKMLGLFNNMLDMPFSKYELQFSFYQILFEQLGLKVNSRKLIWLKGDGTYSLYDTEDYTTVLNDYLTATHEN